MRFAPSLVNQSGSGFKDTGIGRCSVFSYSTLQDPPSKKLREGLPGCVLHWVPARVLHFGEDRTRPSDLPGE